MNAEVPQNWSVPNAIQILTGNDEDKRWQENARCAGVDPDLFFPKEYERSDEAKAICHECPVRQECLEYALAHGEKFGVWGGLTERERRRVRRQRALARRAVSTAFE
jgi:WhiB family redox-sensing transcriptional regulator